MSAKKVWVKPVFIQKLADHLPSHAAVADLLGCAPSHVSGVLKAGKVTKSYEGCAENEYRQLFGDSSGFAIISGTPEVLAAVQGILGVSGGTYAEVKQVSK